MPPASEFTNLPDRADPAASGRDTGQLTKASYDAFVGFACIGILVKSVHGA